MVLLEVPILPPSVNNRGKSWRVMHGLTNEFKAHLWSAAADADLTDIGFGSKTDPLMVEVGYLFGPERGARQSDTMSNREKAVLDALKFAGIITDDRYVKQGWVGSAHAEESSTLTRVSRVPVLSEAELRGRFA